MYPQLVLVCPFVVSSWCQPKIHPPTLLTFYQESTSMHGRVELAGVHTRGATVFDWGFSSLWKDQKKNIHVVTKFDVESEYQDFVCADTFLGFQELMHQLLQLSPNTCT
jgi:hypothetical protein